MAGKINEINIRLKEKKNISKDFKKYGNGWEELTEEDERTKLKNDCHKRGNRNKIHRGYQRTSLTIMKGAKCT